MRRTTRSSLDGRANRHAFFVVAAVAALTAAPAAQAEGRGGHDDVTVDPCAKEAGRHVVQATGESLAALARCHEREGRSASAWAEYLDAATMAQREKRPDVASSAKQRARALEKTLSTLAVRVPAHADLRSLEVRRDGVLLDRAAWGTPAPVDPGEHEVVATAPGKKPWTTVVVVNRDKHAAFVDVGPFDDDDAIATSADPTSTTSTDHATVQRGGGSAQRTVGLALAGLGLAGVGVGAYFGVQTLDRSDAARQACPSSPCSDRAGVDLNEEAKRSGLLSTVGFAVGGAALITGAVLFFTAPKSERGPSAPPTAQKPRVDVAAGPAFTGLRLGGSF